MENLQYRGVWWLPKDEITSSRKGRSDSIPRSPVGGIMKFSPTEGAQLEMIGSLDPISSTDRSDTIFGVTTEGNKITLKRSHRSNTQKRTSSARFISETWEAEHVFVNAHLFEERFNQLTVRFPHLEEWTSIQKTIDYQNSTNSIESWEEKKKTAPNSADIILYMYKNMGYDGSSGYPDCTWIHLSSNNTLQLSEYRKQYIRNLQNFFTLAIGTPIYPLQITAPKSGGLGRDIRIYYRITGHRQDNKTISPHSMNFTLEDIDFSAAIQKWFSSAESVRRLHDNRFSVDYNEDMYLDSEFMILVIALETYHRRMYHNKQNLISQSKYNKYTKSAIEQIPEPEVKKRVGDLLESNIGNEPSLKDRLEHITNDHRAALPDSMNVYKAVREIRDMRHSVFHGLDQSIDSEKLVKVTDWLRVISDACLLRAAGLGESKINEILTSKYSYRLKNTDMM